MFNVSEFKKAVKSLGREASDIDEFCKEVKLYMKAEKLAVREKVVNIYTFEELSPEMQSKVLDNNRDINVDHDWYDSDIDFWADKLKEMGWGDVDIAFSGFGSQGDGASFTATNIDIQKLINTYGITEQFKNIYTHDVKADITRSGRYVHKNSTSLSFEDYSEETPESEKELGELEKFLTEKMRGLNQEIYAALEKDYEYQTSDEAVKETILANDYEFTENGKIEASKKKADYQGWTPKKIKERLEYLRGEIEAERISMDEILELQSLSDYIDPSDVLLREWAGIPETTEASKKKADYQGWKNYESWVTALWLDNDGFEAPEEMTESYDLAEYIRDIVEEGNPLADEANMYSDLLSGALSDVNYKEIAEHILSMRE